MSAFTHVPPERWRQRFGASVLVISAWVALAAWSSSPYAEWLDHARMNHLAAPAALRVGIFTLG